MLCTLLLSFGVPMLLGGDELGRTQGGNNNAYCQDNEISWFDWGAADGDLLGYVKRVIALRMAHPVFRRKRFLTGAQASELGWFTPAGQPMTQECWDDEGARCLAVYLDGADAPDEADDGTPLYDDDFLVLVNGWWEPLAFTIPAVRPVPQEWGTELDSYDTASCCGTAVSDSAVSDSALRAGDQLTIQPRSVTVLRSPRG
jgi:glycogen operon protein